ncbi:hypothetical protein NXF25_015154 [Crotalus adamanteus]|uniref:Peptidase S1 domain-containing protein n=1 Tax=Crotalus adamanteus TaxID=8729 RepID=A0AAW1AYM7_CROAD
MASSATAAEGERVLGGKPCLPNSQPWQAALFSGCRLICGGTLIHPSWVLSAAHCRKSSIFPVRLGEHHLRRIDWSEQFKLSSKAIVHPEYNRQTLNNDIMLVKLLIPATLNDKVKVLNLTTSCPEPGTKCLISGWGTTSSPQDNLRPSQKRKEKNAISPIYFSFIEFHLPLQPNIQMFYTVPTSPSSVTMFAD